MTGNALKEKFYLDPAIHFLNHGSFGATPKDVLRAFYDWVERSERQPVLFYAREFHAHLAAARKQLASYLGTAAERLVFVPNATHGVNLMARSIPLQPGDEVLMTDHEYGACENVWHLRCAETGASLRHVRVSIPYVSQARLRDQILETISPKTRILYLSHISSPTALTFPVAEIVAAARELGIVTCIDGAHAPGMVPLDLDAICADFYTGNCHKWMCTPRGSGFLSVSEPWVDRVVPNVISWGTGPFTENTVGNRLIDGNTWLGTQSPCSYLSVPATITFLRDNDWDRVRCDCHALLTDALREVNELIGFAPLYPSESGVSQMGIAELPSSWDPARLKTFLYDRFRVEVPIIRWKERNFVRVSCQGYNDNEDVCALVAGLEEFKGKESSK